MRPVRADERRAPQSSDGGAGLGYDTVVNSNAVRNKTSAKRSAVRAWRVHGTNKRKKLLLLCVVEHRRLATEPSRTKSRNAW